MRMVWFPKWFFTHIEACHQDWLAPTAFWIILKPVGLNLDAVEVTFLPRLPPTGQVRKLVSTGNFIPFSSRGLQTNLVHTNQFLFNHVKLKKQQLK